MFGGLHEECGVMGIFAGRKAPVAEYAYLGLYALQHRGQESCGIAVSEDGLFRQHRGDGLVAEVFSEEQLAHLGQGSIAVGHVRYSTTGGKNPNNIQPVVVCHVKGNMALCHNGNLVNANELRRAHELKGAIFHGTADTESMIYTIVGERLTAPSTEEAVARAMPRLQGAYSCVLMTATKLIAFRDPNGFRPLCYGRTESGEFIVASESCALDAVGAHLIRDIEPGEILVFSDQGVQSDRRHCGGRRALCVFEYIYFARPDSVIEGASVHSARLMAGKFLAKESPAQADVVIGVPDSGLDAALGFAQQSGIRYGVGFLKNKYVGRSFIAPSQQMREKAVRIKLNVIRETVEGKRVVLVDDSIVRGTTCSRIVRLLRDSGAKEVHIRLACPPIMYGCKYLNFSRSSSEMDLITRRVIARLEGDKAEEKLPLYADPDTPEYAAMVEEIRSALKFTTLGYHRLDDMIASTGLSPCKLCTYCWNGKE